MATLSFNLKEDAEDYKLAELAWKEFVASGEEGIPDEEVFKN